MSEGERASVCEKESERDATRVTKEERGRERERDGAIEGARERGGREREGERDSEWMREAE